MLKFNKKYLKFTVVSAIRVGLRRMIKKSKGWIRTAIKQFTALELFIGK